MSTGVSESRVLAGDNPFDVDPDHYKTCATPDHSDLRWSETHFWSAWNPDDGVGFFIHVGTTPEDADLWWAQVMVMLPGGRTLADMSWGRSPDRDGPTTGNFRARSPQLGHFTLSFDGAGEITSSDEMARRIVGAGRSLPCSFEIELAPAMPVWDLFRATRIGEREWGGVHHEQTHSATGWLKVAGSPDSGRSIQTLLMWNKVMSNTSPNTNFNGAALDAGDEALLLAQCAVKMTWPDGDVGYGHLERGYRRNLLPPLNDSAAGPGGS